MITYKPIIISGGRRKDGTWPVKIRITFKSQVRRIPTTLVCTDADLYEGIPPQRPYWRYFRKKTTKRRTDRAEVIVAVEAQMEAFIKILQDGTGLHLWKSSRIADTQVNKYLRQWAEREGVEPFTFYAARHSWATIARRLGVEKATIDEALGHIGDYKVADIYAERNWSLAWEANRKVLAEFSWFGQQ